jgi:hypothetical protein
MVKRAKIGDIIEIPTSKGLAYAQYTHHHKKYGTLIRVLDGIFKDRPESLSELVKRKYKYFMFAPIQLSINKGKFNIVGHADLPLEAQNFPLFHSGYPDENGIIRTW